MRTFLSQGNQYNASIVGSPAEGIMIARSTDAADTMVARVWGTLHAGATGIANYTLTGKLEKATSAYDSITRIELASAAAGAITFRKPGTKASGKLTVTSNPTDGQQVVLGVTGNTTTYTFKDGEKTTAQCVSNAADALDGKYFDIYDGANAVRVWFNSTTAGAAAPATPSGGRLLEVSIANTDNTAILVATKLATAMDADSKFRASSSGTDTVTIFNADTIMNTTNASAGTSGFTMATPINGPDSAYNVLIGKDKYLSMRNLNEAINNSGSAGTRYGSATVACPYLTGWSNTGHTVTALNGTSHTEIFLQDVLACNRQLSWVNTVPASMTREQPTGGIDGDIICEMAPAQYGAGGVVTLDSVDSVNMSVGSVPVFDPIEAFGRHARLYVQNEGPGEVDLEIFAGPDVDHLVSQETLNCPSNSGVVVQSAIVGPAQFVKVVGAVTSDDCAVYAALVY